MTFGKAFVGRFSWASTWKLSRLQVFQPHFFEKPTQSNFFCCLLSLSLKLPTCISQQELVNLLHSSLASICWWATEQPARAARCQPWLWRRESHSELKPLCGNMSVDQKCLPKTHSAVRNLKTRDRKHFRGPGKGRRRLQLLRVDASDWDCPWFE